jgi:hypothetical protein
MLHVTTPLFRGENENILLLCVEILVILCYGGSTSDHAAAQTWRGLSTFSITY